MGVLFISHSSLDNDPAIRVRDWLRTNGWGEVFLDLDPAQGLAPGQRWQEELKRAGENCAAVIVLVSPHWIASRWCQTEFLLADQLGKCIFPVFIAPTPFDDLPLEMKAKFQLADISTPEKEAEGFQRLGVGLKRAGLDPKSFDWPPPNEPQRAVYRGLQALDAQDAAIFFGRDAHITRGLDDLRRLRDGAPQRLLVILGASGAGKSSFLRAGLIARLKRDEENYLVLPIVRPERAALSGSQGLAASLSAALGRRVELGGGADVAHAFAEARKPAVERFTRNADAARETYAAKPPTIILPIDQAEELFGAENAERAQFCEMLAAAVAQDGDTLIVATIRSDSYEPLQTERALANLGQLLFNLPPIAAGSFQEIIEGPARLAKPLLTIEPALTQQLLADLDAADALPLLAFTLERLQAQYGQDGKLTLAAYRDKLGGLAGAIQSAVNAVLGDPPSKDKLALARRLFVPALVQVDQDGVKRRVARRQDLPPDVQALADRFVAQRLLVTDQGSIEVAHEAILRQWLDLEDWIAAEHYALGVLNSVQIAAREWTLDAYVDDGPQSSQDLFNDIFNESNVRSRRRQARQGRKVKILRPDAWLAHRGDRLKEAEEIAARAEFSGAVDERMRDYLAACRKAERRSAASRLRMQLVAIVLTLAVLGGGYAYTQRDVLEPMALSALRYKQFVHTDEDLRTAAPGTTFQDCREGSADCPVMVVIPQGRFVMGSPADDPEYSADESPQRQVSIARFAVSQHEITFADWNACVAAGGCDRYQPNRSGWEGDDRPVINVSWDEAEKYVAWLKRMTGQDYRLLTEAEWEYAARGVTTTQAARTRFSWGDDDPVCQTKAPNGAAFSACEQQSTWAVGSFPANAFGLYDMHGNVWEWVEDCYAGSYAGAPLDGGAVTSRDCSSRVLRGGSWVNDPQILRSALRYRDNPTFRFSDVGFRVARTL